MLIEYFLAVRLKEFNADKEAWEAPAITVTCVETAQQNWNRCLIDVGKTTGSTLQWRARPFDDFFAICSPNQGIASAHLSRTQGDSEGVQERWQGQKGLSRRVTAVPIG